MAKLTRKIPKDIREYKEKIVFGLSLRKLGSVFIALVICLPLYFFGSDIFGEELTSWLVIILAVLIALIGFAEKNGMTYDKYLMAVIKSNIIYPQKTMFKSSNFFAENEALAKQEELQGISKSKLKKYNKEASLEKAFLLEEMYNNGIEITVDIDKVELLTAGKLSKKNNSDSGKKDMTMENKKNKTKSKAQLVAEEVEQKKKENPQYIPTPKEGKMLLKYANEVNQERIKQIQQGKKDIVNKNKDMNKRKKAKTYIPKSSQDDLPYLADFDEGLFEVEPNIYSKCYEILDINYLTAKDDEAEFIYNKWGEFLNYFSEDVSVSMVIDNKIVSFEEQVKKVSLPYRGDKLDIHRKEWNKILKKQLMNGNNDILQSKYITVSIEAFSPYEALLKFRKLDNEVISNLEKIGSNGKVLSTDERLELLHDKMRKGREGQFNIDYDFLKLQGISSKDYVAPSSFWFKSKSYFMIEDTYFRCVYVNNLPARLTDEFMSSITQCDFPLTTTMSINPIDQEKAHTMIKRRITGMEANKIEAERKAMKNGYDPNSISHDLKRSYQEGLELLERVENNDEKLFLVSIMLMVGGDTLEELNEHTEILRSKIRGNNCQLQVFDNQQREAYKVIMPMGIRPKGKLFVDRALPTESTAIFIPFTTQELFEENGVYIGLNQISHNLIICDRTKLKTPSGFVLGSSGSGKSFKCKETMLSILLSDDETGLMIIDPENEYKILAMAFGGTILTLSPSTKTYINPMDMDEDYGLEEDDEADLLPLDVKKDKALRKKSDYLMSIIQCMITDGEGVSIISPAQKSLIDRAIKRAYENYLNNNFDINYLPTLLDLQEELDKEKGTEDGRLVAEAVEYYTKGSMNLYSHYTNVNLDNRFIVFAIRDLTEELKQISLLIVLDFIWNKMTANSYLKKRTYCFVDEVHILFANLFSARYLQQLYKRGRKYGLVITGITQDLEEVLKSEMARSMIQNSEFIIMLNQTGENLESLTKLRRISEAQRSYVEMADTGCGLLFAGKTVIPFEDNFPKDSYLYTLLSTDFNEDNEDTIKEILSKVNELEEKEIAS